MRSAGRRAMRAALVLTLTVGPKRLSAVVSRVAAELDALLPQVAAAQAELMRASVQEMQ